jgi:hypothetical protein
MQGSGGDVRRRKAMGKRDWGLLAGVGRSSLILSVGTKWRHF